MKRDKEAPNKLLAEAIRRQDKLKAKDELANRIGWAIIDALEDNEGLVRRVFGFIEGTELSNLVNQLEED